MPATTACGEGGRRRLAKAPEIARRLSPARKVPAVCRDFVECEVPAISGNRPCTRGEKSAFMLVDEVELLEEDRA